MRLTLVIATLGSGGAERVLTTLANHWERNGHEITIITLSGIGNDFYSLEPAIQRVGLDVMSESGGTVSALTGNVRRLASLRSALSSSRPDVVLSFIDRTNVLTLLAGMGLKIPIVVSERVDPRQWPIGGTWNALRRMTYKRAATVVVQTQAVVPWAKEFLPEDKVAVVPNPVTIGLGQSAKDGMPPMQLKPPIACAMGRLVPQKGFDLLIPAFAECARTRPNWTLIILGEGPERKRLEELVARNGLEGRVLLPGNSTNPQAILGQCDLFVLPSRFEGFPMALCEAMAAGATCLSFDCPSGPAEIVRPGLDGMLIPLSEDPSRLADGMARLMDDSHLRAALRSRAPEIAERFSLERISARWLDVFERCLANRPRR
ncbi:MAG: glycosyltransferase family 4 protein [Candidatus Sumerlaeaceae bacterium]|nr:glycosyltransferase family 4 protein [Candidatus Sumerlaeaceae bacterium]